MDTEPRYTPEALPEKPKASFWRKLGGGSLSISIIIHAALVALGIIWVISIIPPPPEKVVDFMPQGGGGGSPNSQLNTQQKRIANMVQQNVSRVAALDVASNFTLPEPDPTSNMDPLASLGAGALSGGLGGSGSGGGRGTGHGTGFGAGSGLGGGGGDFNPFGMIQPSVNALVGSFYDIKQTRDRKPNSTSSMKTLTVINDFVTTGWNERKLSRYYKARQSLYQTRIHIPMMNAKNAPAAFNCEKEVQPSNWVIVYRGVVTPPNTGRYRFVGGADDVLTVRFNNKVVFDHGYYTGTAPVHLRPNREVFRGDKEDREIERLLRRDFPVRVPVTYYKYPGIENWNRAINGLAVGATFEARAGTPYPIDILISELPGGAFGAFLLIEEVGAKYETASSGSPILPLFRLDNSAPDPDGTDKAPPFQKNGPVWKVIQSGPKPGI